MSEWLRYWKCRLLHREGAQCVDCWLQSEAGSKARHPSGWWWR